MSTNILVVYYSTLGHVFQLARCVAEGAGRQPDTEVRIRRVPELDEARRALSGMEAYRQSQQAQQVIPEATHADLRWADGGPGTIAGMDGSLQPKQADVDTARNLGSRIARFATALKALCAEGPHGFQPASPLSRLPVTRSPAELQALAGQV